MGLLVATISWKFQWPLVIQTAITYTLLLLGLMIAARLAARYLLVTTPTFSATEPVLIFGAGSAGSELAGALRNNSSFRPVAFIDDDTKKVGATVKGLPVYPRTKLNEVVANTHAARLLLAVPSLSQNEKSELLKEVAELAIRVQSIPRLKDLVSNTANIDQLHEIKVEDILGRDPVPPDFTLLGGMLSKKMSL